jgi:hypothetical protein
MALEDTITSSMTQGGIGAGLLALIAGMVIFVIILSIALYIYMSFAFMAIGRKAKLKTPEIAWIPGIGPMIIAFQASKMHWWPWLLIIGMFIPFVNFVAGTIFMVFAIIWQWKMFEVINKPGWWAIFFLIPPVLLILYGVAAWSKE